MKSFTICILCLLAKIFLASGHYEKSSFLQTTSNEVKCRFCKVILLLQVPGGDSTPNVKSFAESYPKIYAVGSSCWNGPYVIICEDIELTFCNDFLTSVCLLISYFFTLNIEFPLKAFNTLSFLQYNILKMNSGRIPPKVKTLIRKINSIQDKS